MSYRGPKYSCPKFDEAIAVISEMVSESETLTKVLDEMSARAEKLIEAAREINYDLRCDNERLTEERDKLEEDLDEARSEIQRLRRELNAYEET